MASPCRSPARVERQQGQHGGGRIAAGTGNQPGAGHGRRVELGQAVDRAVGQRVGRRRVEPRALGRVLEAKRPGEVDDAVTAGKQFSRARRGERFGGAQEYHVAPGKGVRAVGRDLPIPGACEAGQGPGLLRVARPERNLEIGARVSGQQAHELLSAVPGGADDSDSDALLLSLSHVNTYARERPVCRNLVSSASEILGLFRVPRGVRMHTTA